MRSRIACNNTKRIHLECKVRLVDFLAQTLNRWLRSTLTTLTALTGYSARATCTRCAGRCAATTALGAGTRAGRSARTLNNIITTTTQCECSRKGNTTRPYNSHLALLWHLPVP